MRLTHGLILITTLVWLAACGGGGSGNNNGGSDNNGSDGGGTTEPEKPIMGKLVVDNPRSADNPQLVIRNITFNTAPAEVAQRTGQTNSDGEFEYLDAETVTFNLLGESFGPIPAKAIITQDNLAESYCKDKEKPLGCTANARRNLQRTLLSIDADDNEANGITPYAGLTTFPLAIDRSIDAYELALTQHMAEKGRELVPLFKPSLGINLEEPQPEADDVGGQPIPFADIFRIGRPFPEYSCSEIVYDEFGWPVTIPEACNDEEHPVLRVPSYATTLILRFLPQGSLPVGKYTVLYEGTGNIQYSGIANKLPAESVQGRDIIEITADLLTSRARAGLRVQIKDITEGDHIRNVRIVMPGGICEGNPFLRVAGDSDCPSGQYRSFVDSYELDRNAIVFNPAFMRFLKDFKAIRMMNFMKASPRNPCYIFKDEAYFECLLQDFDWDQRAKMDDAMWGGSFLTDLAERANRGVPLEVAVELANQLKRDPWFNIPHNATDDYVKKYATYVRDNLDADLKAHIEYSNEPWNGQFWANLYLVKKGRDAELDTRDYWAGLYFYTERSVEIFSLWQEVWGGTERLVRIINTQHNGGQFASRNMLNHKGAYQSIDAVASGPYFFGCWDRANARCVDEDANPLMLKDITSVDDIFTILDNPDNPYGIASTLKFVTEQAKVAEEFDVDLYAYEGGQHLTVIWGDSEVSHARKNNILDLFRAANRDSRMTARYLQLLKGWKKEGGKLFALYTLPQTYHRFGSFGIKEHMAQPRDEAPKYDGAMRFQEEQGRCWWENCE